ncbi:TPA: hypothetical protein LR286_003851 [Enterobacter hormaechei]|nr:hypothetical protein [Enterobacter hormaechei]HBL5177359.1 hypothetical protein [Enterobacter hormaechei]HBL6016474.1 hypothetical protein [Enterobacter hormaechei]HBL6130936.1 hypothetical protein [Enterobacter hormaechei]HBL8997799.1 hypothetical protein [Enterobacter hormaechei]
MGGRTQVGMGWANNQRKLVALDKNTLEPVVVDWSYEDNPDEIFTGSMFADIKPTKRLLANSEIYVRGSLLNFSNIGGAGSSFAAILDNGKVVSWGLPGSGADTPTSERNHNVNVIYGSDHTSVGINNLNQIFVWGKTADDPIPDDITALNDITVVKCFTVWAGSERAFLALRDNKQIVQWNDPGYPWTLPEHIAEMKDIIAIESTLGAFAAIKENGHVIAWGDPKKGGELPAHLNDISDAIKIFANNEVFIVLHRSGKISAWGDSDKGGVLPDNIAALSDIINVYPYFDGFVAQRINNSLVEWGWETDTVPPEIANRTDILDVQMGENHSGAVLLPEGKVFSWGKLSNPHFVQQPENLSGVIHICASADCIAALKSDGSVVAWGHPDQGGDTTPVANELYDIRAIYGSIYGFCALRNDGKVIVWGEYGGDMSKVPPEIQNNITYAWE